MPNNKSKSFRARLEKGERRLGWTILHVPFDVAKVWGTRGQLKVRGEINGYPFRTSLFASGTGRHFMIVNKKMQAGAGISAGDTAQLRLEPDTETRTVSVPPELERILRQSAALRRSHDALNYSTRREIAKWISEAKQPSTRKRRADRMAERLLSAMEAERELPPVIARAFAHNPRAHDGWKRMSSSQRRMHLLGIFYYRNPDSQARRIEKAVQAAAEVMDRLARKQR